MNFWQKVPFSVSVSVLSEWICLQDVVYIDYVLSNAKDREKFKEIVIGHVQELHVMLNKLNTVPVAMWAMRRFGMYTRIKVGISEMGAIDDILESSQKELHVLKFTDIGAAIR